MEKDKEEKKDKSNKQNFFSKIFKSKCALRPGMWTDTSSLEKKKDEKNDKNAVDKPKDKSTYFVALTGTTSGKIEFENNI